MPAFVTTIEPGGQSDTLVRSTIVYSVMVGPVIMMPIGIMSTAQYMRFGSKSGHHFAAPHAAAAYR